MKRAIIAGTVYFAVVFAIGFALGVVRVGVFASRFGEVSAVLVEMPVILLASWFICRWAIHKFDVFEIPAYRLLMGIVALALLLVAEIGVSVLAFERSFAEHLDAYSTLPVLLGLAGQVVYALFPVFQLNRSHLSVE